MLSRPRDPRAAAELAGADGVELVDFDDERVLAGAYRSAWVSALPSEREAFGLVLAEALACGTPGVGTAAGGIPEVLDDEAIGRTFDGTEAGLARALLEAFELASDARTAERCRARAERLSPERLAGAYGALYRELREAAG
jgi:glycosyltransferase involved in cell wall biosynthesis